MSLATICSEMYIPTRLVNAGVRCGSNIHCAKSETTELRSQWTSCSKISRTSLAMRQLERLITVLYVAWLQTESWNLSFI